MAPPEVAGPETHRKTGRISQLLDAAFGFFVWTIHFLAIYIATALACVLGLGAASEGTRATFLTVLGLVTVSAATVVVLHALRRYRQQRDVPEQRFRLSVTVGCDAIATLAIAGQLLPILLVPLCA
jgi:hypothetical protein